MVVFEVLSPVGKLVRLDEERWSHVMEHPEMEGQLDRLRESLQDPDEVRRSIHDASVWLFYKHYADTPVTDKYLLVAVRILNDEGFIVTAFFTERPKRGTLLWSRKP